jgi:AraC family transcriptional regulator of adaptative response/methylated-DNA-[protein]-cysteine methyltransferase
MTMRHAGELLAAGRSTLEAADEAGLSGNGRLHDLMVTCAGITPGEAKARGRGLVITYGSAPSPFGRLIIARTVKGICWLGFMVDESEAACLQRIKSHFPLAALNRDDAAVIDDASFISLSLQGEAGRKPMILDLYGTNFQLQVWQALLRIPCGKTLDYQSIARNVGRPRASRAVGNAVGANPVSLIIPCHRVIRASGIIDNYGWGSARKKVLLGLEMG